MKLCRYGLFFMVHVDVYLPRQLTTHWPAYLGVYICGYFQETGPFTDLDLQGASQNPHAAVEKTHMGRTQGVTLAQTTFKVLFLFMFVLMGKTTNNVLFGAS